MQHQLHLQCLALQQFIWGVPWNIRCDVADNHKSQMKQKKPAIKRDKHNVEMVLYEQRMLAWWTVGFWGVIIRQWVHWSNVAMRNVQRLSTALCYTVFFFHISHRIGMWALFKPARAVSSVNQLHQAESRKVTHGITIKIQSSTVLCSDLLMNACSHSVGMRSEVVLSGSGFQRFVITKDWHTRTLDACCVTTALLPIDSPLHLSHDFEFDETVLTGI